MTRTAEQQQQRPARTAPIPDASPPGSARLPWWGAALAVFAASRVVTTLLMLWVGTQATPLSRAGAHPTLVQLSTAWDGTWYWWVAVNGYPAVLPHTASGAVDTNAWAFLPAYPMLVKALALGSTPGWPPVAILVSVAFGFGCAVLLAALLRPRIGDGPAVFAVAVFSVSPLAFVLQMAYAESMALFLLLAVLRLLDRHRYLTALPVVLLLAVTRPGVLALAPAVGLHLVVRIVWTRRGADDLTVAQGVRAAALAVVAGLAGFVWPAAAAIATGRPDAYFRTEAAWRALWLGDRPLGYFTPWLDAGRYWAAVWFGADSAALLGPALVVLLVAGFTALLLSRPVRRLGPTIRLWCASYGLYLLAVFFPQSSIFRLLMPLAPLAGAAVPRSRPARVAVLVAATALQALWLWVVLGPAQRYWGVL